MVYEEVIAPRGSEAQLHFMLGNALGTWLSLDNRTPHVPLCLARVGEMVEIALQWAGSPAEDPSESIWQLETGFCGMENWTREVRSWKAQSVNLLPLLRGCCVGGTTAPWGAAPFSWLLSLFLGFSLACGLEKPGYILPGARRLGFTCMVVLKPSHSPNPL